MCWRWTKQTTNPATRTTLFTTGPQEQEEMWFHSMSPSAVTSLVVKGSALVVWSCQSRWRSQLPHLRLPWWTAMLPWALTDHSLFFLLHLPLALFGIHFFGWYGELRLDTVWKICVLLKELGVRSLRSLRLYCLHDCRNFFICYSWWGYADCLWHLNCLRQFEYQIICMVCEMWD